MSNKEMLYEMRKKMIDIIYGALGGDTAFDIEGGFHPIRDTAEEIVDDQILAVETDTCRIAVVRKQGELPMLVPDDAPHNYGKGFARGEREFAQSMLNAGYVQEVKDEQT